MTYEVANALTVDLLHVMRGQRTGAAAGLGAATAEEFAQQRFSQCPRAVAADGVEPWAVLAVTRALIPGELAFRNRSSPGSRPWKVAIGTGGSSGLGRGIVRRFVDAGAAVVIADINDDDGQQLADECGARARFQHVDVSIAEDVSAVVQAAVNHFGGLDVMVNNAGISSKMHKGFLHDDLADFSKVMSVNLLGVMLGTREAARYMADDDGGSIINVASIGGLQAGGGVMTYRASKAAVIHFSKSVATELAPLGISVNCLAPGGVPTPILASSVHGLSVAPMSSGRRLGRLIANLVVDVKGTEDMNRPGNAGGS